MMETKLKTGTGVVNPAGAQKTDWQATQKLMQEQALAAQELQRKRKLYVVYLILESFSIRPRL